MCCSAYLVSFRNSDVLVSLASNRSLSVNILDSNTDFFSASFLPASCLNWLSASLNVRVVEEARSSAHRELA